MTSISVTTPDYNSPWFSAKNRSTVIMYRAIVKEFEAYLAYLTCVGEQAFMRVQSSTLFLAEKPNKLASNNLQTNTSRYDKNVHHIP